MAKKVLLSSITLTILFFQPIFAQLTVDNQDPYDDPVYLIDEVLLGEGVTATNHSYMGHEIQIGYFDGSNSNIGLDGGVVLGTGDIFVLDTPFVIVGPIDGEFINLILCQAVIIYLFGMFLVRVSIFLTRTVHIMMCLAFLFLVRVLWVPTQVQQDFLVAV